MIHFNRVFHYMPSMLGCPYFWKHPFRNMSFYRSACVFPMLGCEQFCASDANSRTVMVVARHLLEKLWVESSRDGHGEVGWDDWWSQIPSFCCGEGDLKVLFVGFSIGTCALCWCIHLFYSSKTIICNQPSLRQSGNAIHVTGHSLGGWRCGHSDCWLDRFRSDARWRVGCGSPLNMSLRPLFGWISSLPKKATIPQC